jgi:hypothetical protein
VDIETDGEHGCLPKSMYLGTAASGFHVTQLTEAFYIVSAPKSIDPKLLPAIRPTRATTSLAASVDHTEARCASMNLGTPQRAHRPSGTR